MSEQQLWVDVVMEAYEKWSEEIPARIGRWLKRQSLPVQVVVVTVGAILSVFLCVPAAVVFVFGLGVLGIASVRDALVQKGESEES